MTLKDQIRAELAVKHTRTPRQVIERKCATCKRIFKARRKTARYCDDLCRVAAFRARRVKAETV